MGTEARTIEAGWPAMAYLVGSWVMVGSPYCLSWRRICSRMKGPRRVAPRSTLGQVLSMVERTKEEVSTGVTELAKSVEWAHLGAPSVPGLGAMLSGSGTKRPG